MAEKDNRCWPGYEPVKGKPAHSQGSCKPKAESKTTPPQKQFRAKRKKQLDEWQKEHPQTSRSAAQHLHAPEADTKKATTKVAKAATTKVAKTKKTARKPAKKAA